MENSIVLGVDIGGSHITAALVDLEQKAIVPETWARSRVDSRASADEIIGAWASVIREALRKNTNTVVKIGIAIPGPFDYKSGISFILNQNKYDALYGLNVKELLAEKLSISKNNICLYNDAGCFLIGEVFGGAAIGARKAIGLTLGTGLGSARFHGGVADDADKWREPYKDSIAEEYISTRAVVKSYEKLTGGAVKGVEELTWLYESDPQVKQVFSEFAENLASFLIPFIQEDDPEMIVIGGNIAKAWDLFIPETEKRLAEHAIQVDLRKAKLGESAALIGAASYWQEGIESSILYKPAIN